MKVVYLVRHAKSSWDDPDLDDINRPLNNRGKRDAPEMGERLKNLQLKPDLLISSPAKRAISTAKEIAKKIGYPVENIRNADEFYHGNMDSMLNYVRNINHESSIIVLFGHNPVLTEFANSLCGVNIHNIPTCGIVAIEFDIPDWGQVEYKKGKLVFFDYPKKNVQA